jgi:hypothetical protein
MSSQAAPSGLAKSAVTAGLKAGRMTAGSSTLTFIKGALKIMAWSKAKTAIVAGVVVLFAAGTATVTVKEIQEHRTYPWQEGKLLDRDKLDQVPPQVRILPQKSHAVPNGWASNPNKKIIGLGVDFKIMIQAAYAFTYGTKRLTRILPLVELPPGHFDFISTLPSGSPEALQQEIRRKFGLVAELETKETDVLLLTVSSGNAPGLKPTANGGYSIDSLRMLLEDYFQVPVLDQTGLAGNFDMEAKWNRPFKGQNQDALKRDLLDQLGIELVPSRESVEMLVVEKAK